MSETRTDGYVNMLNRYGTQYDTSENYTYHAGGYIPDIELSIHYESNGLFAKIIDEPAEEALKNGFTLGMGDKDAEHFVETSLDELEFEEKAVTAMKWARLYGGSVIVMVINDGGGLEDPLDWNNIKGIDDLLVFERPFVTPDHNDLYASRPDSRYSIAKMGTPQHYGISHPYGGTFRVHESRCMVFKNGTMPLLLPRSDYSFFGVPEYTRISKELKNTVTAHGNGVKMLDRAVQAIYKMKDLAGTLSTDEGEEAVLKRLQLIDMARGLINTIAIDGENEDYDFRSMSFAGVKDVIDTTCNMLSAITHIPQTILFGRSPAGENSTGESDLENYYNFVSRRMQKNMLRKNINILINVIMAAGKTKGDFGAIPEYKLEFVPLWSLNEKEKTDIEKTKADTEMVKAQTAQAYVDMQALDASEVRAQLAKKEEFMVSNILDDDVEGEWGGLESKETEGTALSALKADMNMDSSPSGCGVIVIKDGRILVGNRLDNGLVCGPGGHIEKGEAAEEAAAREAREEFDITVKELIPVTTLDCMPSPYCPSSVFICTKFEGEPIAANDEMENARFESLDKILNDDLFLPFRLSLVDFMEQLNVSPNTS